MGGIAIPPMAAWLEETTREQNKLWVKHRQEQQAREAAELLDEYKSEEGVVE